MPFLAIFWKYGNINPLSITYPFRVLLRDRLTLGRLPLPRKPWVCGGRVFHSSYRYSCQHSHFLTLHPTLRCSFIALGTLFYHTTAPQWKHQIINNKYQTIYVCNLEFGIWYFQCEALASTSSVNTLAPLYCRRRITWPVSCYAFFKGWLLLSQPPGCLSNPTSLPT